ncbi:PulJ/GspJ family protein [Hyphomonas polymorpha]|nr:type II secretion system protein [Hyphomonas polymorpha]
MGFSLIEVMVGLAIMAIISMLIFSSLLSQMQQADIVRSSTRDAFERIAQRRLVETVVSATLPTWPEDKENAFTGTATQMSGVSAFSLFDQVQRLQAYSLTLRMESNLQVLEIVTEEGVWTVEDIPQDVGFRYLGGDGLWHTSWPLGMPDQAGIAQMEQFFANQGLPRMVALWDEQSGGPAGVEIAISNTDILGVRVRDLAGEFQ